MMEIDQPESHLVPIEAIETTDSTDGDAHSDAANDEYETGRVICEICGQGVSFRDEATGEFTLQHWDAHRAVCVASTQYAEQEVTPSPIRLPPTHPSSALTPAPSSVASLVAASSLITTEILSNSSKRRRAKRTEDERIEYLQNDPHVAEFEAYRVLCGNCNKWIRLRPNSTYCSIPWDAHRKSCLARKAGRKSKSPNKAHATPSSSDPRSAYFAKDPEVRRFEGDQILCNICVKWVSLAADDEDDDTAGDELEEEEEIEDDYVRRWLKHRASCAEMKAGDNEGSSTSIQSAPRPFPPSNFPIMNSNSLELQNNNALGDYLSSPQASASANGGSTRQSPVRRLNAEQRASFLRADPLIAHVEPNRVYCTLCEKWVQLRHDSSFCAYPWVMHKGKCLRRAERRVQRTAELTELRAQHEEQQRLRAEQQLLTVEPVDLIKVEEEEDDDEDPESEEGVESEDDEDRERRREERKRIRIERKNMKKRRRGRPRKEDQERVWEGQAKVPGLWGLPEREMGGVDIANVKAEEMEEEDELVDDSEDVDMAALRAKKKRRLGANDVAMDYAVGGGFRVNGNGMDSRALADLDSPVGRASFIQRSVAHLLTTTYEPSDELTISSLVNYVNAAMPVDKHVDFDRAEVMEALCGKGVGEECFMLKGEVVQPEWRLGHGE